MTGTPPNGAAGSSPRERSNEGLRREPRPSGSPAPFFSVVIPTFRRCHLLPRAVASVLSQSFEDFEIVVVDDASPDATPEIMRRINDPRVRYLRRSKNGGNAATRNTGIDDALGCWIALLDDDDEYLPGFLAKTHAALANAPPEVGFAWCGVRWILDENEESHVLREELWQPGFRDREDAYRGFLRSRHIGTNCGLTLRPNAWREVGGFDENLRCAVDTDFLIRLARRFDFTVVPEVLVRVHLHPGLNVRSLTPEKARAYETILAKHEEVLAADPFLAAELRYKTGWLWYQTGERRRGRRYVMSALRRRPAHLRAWLALLLYETMGRHAGALHRAVSRLRRRQAPLSGLRRR